jgi:hypothetical protein
MISGVECADDHQAERGKNPLRRARVETIVLTCGARA